MDAPKRSMIDSNSTPKRRFSRRDFLKVSAVMGLDTIVLGFAGVSYAWEVEPSWVDINQVKLTLPRLPKAFSGFRIAQLSDIHIGPWMSVERLQELLKLATAQSPDLLALTGDFVLAHGGMNSYRDELAGMSQILSEISKSFAVTAILGNHDYWYNSFEVTEALLKGGVMLLSNAVQTFERNGERFHVAGLDDVYDHHDDLNQVLTQLPDDGCAMLLAHEPDFADTSAATGRFDLQISGHSHGGQVVLPFVGAPVLPYLGQKYPSGLYQVGGMFQYTNRGVGVSIPPVRFNCRPEITVFTLESA